MYLVLSVFVQCGYALPKFNWPQDNKLMIDCRCGYALPKLNWPQDKKLMIDCRRQICILALWIKMQYNYLTIDTKCIKLYQFWQTQVNSDITT